MQLIAIDPGNEKSALVVYDTQSALPVESLLEPNRTIRNWLTLNSHRYPVLALEMIASYGMPVGASIFETVLWVGRFAETYEQRSGKDTMLVYRREVKLHLCGLSRAKDSNIRQALMDRYGSTRRRAIGIKAAPGPLYGMKADMWAALGVAITAAETRLGG